MNANPAANGPATADPRTARVVRFYETLSPATLDRSAEVYADDAHFVDPFNDVHGQAAIRRVLAHMFDNLQSPRFEVLESITEGDAAMLAWDFCFRRQGRRDEWRVHGVSALRFAADGRVQLHRDHWDPARQLYERLPLLGGVLRALRRRLSAGAG